MTHQTLTMPANPASDLLVITSASGKQVTALLPLLRDWKHVRLVVNRASSKQKLQTTYPAFEVVIADLTVPSDCIRVRQGATCIYHIGPSFYPHETEIGYNMIDAGVSESQTWEIQALGIFVRSQYPVAENAAS